MKFKHGSVHRVNRCGGGSHEWWELSEKDREDCLASGGAILPAGGFHMGSNYLVVEEKEGVAVGLAFARRPAAQWWDEAYGDEMVLPAPGHTVRVIRTERGGFRVDADVDDGVLGAGAKATVRTMRKIIFKNAKKAFNKGGVSAVFTAVDETISEFGKNGKLARCYWRSDAAFPQLPIIMGC